MSDAQETRTVEIKRVFDAPIDLVYEAWTKGEHVNQWMKCHPEAEMDVEGWEPRAGAEFRYRMAKEGEFEVHTTGRILEADAPRTFAYAMDADPTIGAPEFTVRIELAEVGEGTELTLTHAGLPNEDFCGIVEGGWSVSLSLLQDLVVALVGAYASVRMGGAAKKDAGEEVQ